MELNDRELALNLMKESLSKAQVRMKNYADKSRREVVFDQGSGHWSNYNHIGNYLMLIDCIINCFRNSMGLIKF